jgi:hypothetical protein
MLDRYMSNDMTSDSSLIVVDGFYAYCLSLVLCKIKKTLLKIQINFARSFHNVYYFNQ